MKKKKGLIFLILTVLAFSMYCLTGCGEEKSGNTISEPDITVDYLHGEYSDQLMTDGAVTMLGSIDVTQWRFLQHHHNGERGSTQLRIRGRILYS